MKKNILVCLMIFNSFFVFSQIDFKNDATNIYSFAVKIAPTAYGVGQYFIVYPTQKELKIIESLEYEMFMRQIMGKEYSIANENNENLLQKNGIKDPNIVAQLWRLRYAIYPFQCRGCDTVGWTYNSANPLMPTQKQLQILSNYGLKTINDLVYGDNLYRLLRDMENKNWVTQYVNASKE